MIKRRIVATLLVAAVFSGPGPAYASHGDPIYNIRYYSDATYTVEVGFDQGDCSWYGAGYSSHSGQSTPYTVYEQIGYCARDGYGVYWEPL
jgi:hypothetical protein